MNRYDYESDLEVQEKELEEYRKKRAERERHRRKQRAKEAKRRRRRVRILSRVVPAIIILIVAICVGNFVVKQVKEYREEARQEAMKQSQMEEALANDNWTGIEADDVNGDLEIPEDDIVIPEEPVDPQEEAVMNNDQIPEDLKALYKKNEEARDFVLGYPEKMGTEDSSPLTEYEYCTEVPLLLQWDPRWGYHEYGNSVMGATGCGPTCLSMVAIYVKNDVYMTPIYIADMAMENGYYLETVGTEWDLMVQGAQKIGLKVEEISAEENVVSEKLEAGYPIIAVLGPGDFTDNGHFVVFTEWDNGTVLVNDPNSYENSMKRWKYADIQDQIKNMWAYSK